MSMTWKAGLTVAFAILAFGLVALGALAGADPEGRSGKTMAWCWGTAVTIALGLLAAWGL